MPLTSQTDVTELRKWFCYPILRILFHLSREATTERRATFAQQKQLKSFETKIQINFPLQVLRFTIQFCLGLSSF